MPESKVTVRLAGFNCDADLIREVVDLVQFIDREGAAGGNSQAPSEAKRVLEELVRRTQDSVAIESFTPETISAAYARISRDPRHVTELRRAARFGVARARKSNESIIFGLGHASVAEHACFNFDVSGISRLASEELQTHRLLSFTEKSQRDITIESDYVLPSELAGKPGERILNESVGKLFDSYKQISDRMLAIYTAAGSGPISTQQQRDNETRAKEDARYLLPLACTTQMGMTMNARNVEHVVCELSDHPLTELRELGKAIADAVGNLAPSLVKYTVRGEYPRSNRIELSKSLTKSKHALAHASDDFTVRLVNHTPDGESVVSRALKFGVGRDTYRQGAESGDVSTDWKTVFRGLGAHDSVPREFELVCMTFEGMVSASCFAQLKRHRMMTLLQQSYETDCGWIVPPSKEGAGLRNV